MEKLISELIISDMSDPIDPAQYGNQRGVSIQHYLINMIHKILTALDTNSRRKNFCCMYSVINIEGNKVNDFYTMKKFTYYRLV